MVSTYTSVLPSALSRVDVVVTASGDYYRFEKATSQALAKQRLSADTLDDSAFNTTTVSFSVSAPNVTITKGTGQTAVHVVTTGGNYYRFDPGITQVALQGADGSGNFASITFSEA